MKTIEAVTSPIAAATPGDANLSSIGRKLDSATFAGLLALLMFAPLAFGSVEPWAIFVLELGSGILLLLWLATQVANRTIAVRPNPLYSPMIAFAGLVVAQLAFTSAYRYATLEQLLLYTTYGILFFLAVQCIQTPERFLAVILAFSIFGFAVAVFSLIHHYTFNSKMYWVRTLTQGGGEWAPYVNRNHFAGFMELLVPFPLAAILSRKFSRSQRALLGFAATLIAGTIFLSLSRGGMATLIVEFGVLLWLFPSRKERRSKTSWYIAALGLATLALVVWLGIGPTLQRFETMQDQTRYSILLDSGRMVAQRPLLGWGLGTFTTIYPMFRRYFTNYFINAAHNDYAEVLVDTGIIGFGIVLWFLFSLFRQARERLRGITHRDAQLTCTVAALVACAGLLAHSMVDFNLHIPANAALFYVLCAIASNPGARGTAAGAVSH